MAQSKFKYAGQAEILRAAQKDENYIRQLNEAISSLALNFGGKKFWLKYAGYHIVISRLIYYASTTLSYFQTLGEEYTGVIPVSKTSMELLSLKRMVLYVLLLSGGRVLLDNLLMHLGKLSSPDVSSMYLSAATLAAMNYSLRIFKHTIPYLERLNKSIFYLNGSYYSFVNRFLGVKHVLIKSWLKDEASLYGFQILAIVSLVNLIVSVLHSYPNWSTADRVNEETSPVDVKLSSKNICHLCLSERRNTSTTPCGHLFCWSCIMKWLQIRKDCPVCKSNVIPSRITFLFNYDVGG